MRIAMMTDSYRPTMDGVVTAVLAQKKALEDLGHTVFIIAPDPGKEFREEGVIYFRSVRFKNYPDYYIPIFPSDKIRILKDLNVDIIQIYGVAFMALKALICSHTLHIPTVMTYVTNVVDTLEYYSPLPLPLDLQKKLAWVYIRQILKRPNALVALTPESVTELSDNGVVPKRMAVIPMGISLERFREGQGSREILERYGLVGKRVVISVGRMSYEKNLPQVIEAMRYMPDDVILLAVGKGPAMEDNIKYARDAGLSDRVVFTGFVPNEDLAKYYGISSAVVSASRFETQGLTIVEAMACGIPAACASGRAFLDVIKDGYNGYLFEDSPEDCARAMMKCLESEGSMIEGVRATAREYSMETVGRKVEALYQSILQDKRGKQ